jgi:hypothetical protein
MSYALIVLPVVAEHRDRRGARKDSRPSAALPDRVRPGASCPDAAVHFAVFFEIVEERAEVVIVGVLHQRRDPASWPGR